MRYCTKCGMQLNDGMKFCAACGAPVFPATGAAATPAYSYDRERYRVENPFVPENPLQSTTSLQIRDLPEYIHKVTMLEKSVYAQSQTIEELSDHIDGLGIPAGYCPPREPNPYSENVLSGTWTAVCCGFSCGLLGWIFRGWQFISSSITCAILFVGIVILYHVMHSYSVNNGWWKDYRENYAAYEAAMEEDKVRIQTELYQKQKLIPVLETMKREKEKTETILSHYYGKGVIYPKYQNLVAMCSIHEYFEARRCRELTGYEGAYNIYENEVRLDRICTKLDEAIERLDEIKQNQYMLYDAIQKTNQLTERLLSETVKQTQLLDQTAQNTALSAHFAQIAADNAEACAWIGIANYAELRKNNYSQISRTN